MTELFAALLLKVNAVIKWIGDLWVAIFKAAYDLVKDGFSWVADQLLTVAVSAAGSFDASGITANLGAWGSLPSEVMNILSLIGVGTAITIITTAIGIRLVLQLIPFVRLGS